VSSFGVQCPARRGTAQRSNPRTLPLPHSARARRRRRGRSSRSGPPAGAGRCREPRTGSAHQVRAASGAAPDTRRSPCRSTCS
jgi:hypothetical protein